MISSPSPLPLCNDLTRGVQSQCFYVLLQLRSLPISLIRIKGIQTANHEIKIVNFPDHKIKKVNYSS